MNENESKKKPILGKRLNDILIIHELDLNTII